MATSHCSHQEGHVESIDMTTPWILRGQGEIKILDQPLFADDYLVGSKRGAESIGVEHRGVGWMLEGCHMM